MPAEWPATNGTYKPSSRIRVNPERVVVRVSEKILRVRRSRRTRAKHYLLDMTDGPTRTQESMDSSHWRLQVTGKRKKKKGHEVKGCVPRVVRFNLRGVRGDVGVNMINTCHMKFSKI